jgi:hypothetical protein
VKQLNQISFDDLFTEEKKEVNETRALSPLHLQVLNLVESGQDSALQLCELLIKSGELSNERYSTNKPKAFGKVCSILEDLVSQGTLIFIEDKDRKDRIYTRK